MEKELQNVGEQQYIEVERDENKENKSINKDDKGYNNYIVMQEQNEENESQ